MKDRKTLNEERQVLLDKSKILLKNRTCPGDRIEAALFGYTEEEWQELCLLAHDITIINDRLKQEKTL